jgi:hypothetical protein
LIQIAGADKTMRDPKASDADKAIAIAWFLHLAGDMHQPLHNSAARHRNGAKGRSGRQPFSIDA